MKNSAAKNTSGETAISYNLSESQFQRLLNNFGRSSIPRTSKRNAREYFRSCDFGIFDPRDNARPSVYTHGTKIYHDVFSFTTRLRMQIVHNSWSGEYIAKNLDRCLVGKAELWYTHELSTSQRIGLTAGIAPWCIALEKRFRQPHGEVLDKLETSQYTVADVRDHKDPMSYMHDMLVKARHVSDVYNDHQTILIIYNHLDAKLRTTLRPPTEDTTISEFSAQLRCRKETWLEMYDSDTSSLS